MYYKEYEFKLPLQKAYMYKYNFKRFHSAIGYQKPMNMYLEFIKNVG